MLGRYSGPQDRYSLPTGSSVEHTNDLIYQLVSMTDALTYTKIILILRNVGYPIGGQLRGQPPRTTFV